MKSAGGDYSSLSSAEAGEQGDLTSLDRILQVECYSMADTTAVTIDGWTTSVPQYIRIYTPTTERHDGKWNTSKYRLTPANTAITINEDFVRVDGIQIQCTSTTTGGFGIRVDAATAGADVRVEACVILTAGSGTINEYGIYSGATNANVTFRNSVVVNNGTVGSSASCVWCNLGNTFAIENCTLIVTGNRIGILQTAGTLTVKNTYVRAGAGGTVYDGTMTRTTCAHDTSATFSGSTASVAYSTSNFVSVTGGSEDLHLVSGSALLDVGTDLSASFTVDIDGDTRPQNSVFDIGADEFVVAAGGQPTWKRFGGVAYAANNMPGVW